MADIIYEHKQMRREEELYLMSERETTQSRLRLIDHFKRVYTIVVGLAITDAVRRIFPIEPTNIPISNIIMFFAFFLTLVPIFHGGDRSLDVKYAGESQEKFKQKFSYLWDVYMLLLTAILFVCIAESIPLTTLNNEKVFIYKGSHIFYYFMFITLTFDVIVLFIDRKKSKNKASLGAYTSWMAANCVLAAVCYWAYKASSCLVDPSDWTLVKILGHDIAFIWMNTFVLVVALFRTAVDYASDHLSEGKFLFP